MVTWARVVKSKRTRRAARQRFSGSTKLGHEPKLRPNWDPEVNQVVLPDPSQTFLDDAVVVAWEVFVKMVSHQHSVYLQVWRPKQQSSDSARHYLPPPLPPPHQRKRLASSFLLVGQTFFQPKTLLLHTLTLKGHDQIPVRKGDVLGFYHPHSNPLAFDFVPCAFLEQLSRRSKLPENFRRPMNSGEVLSFQSHSISSDIGNSGSAGEHPLKFPSNRSSESFCRQYSFAAVLANMSNPLRTRTIDDWPCPDHRLPFHLRGFHPEAHRVHLHSGSSDLRSGDVAPVDRKHDEFRSRQMSRQHHHHHRFRHDMADQPPDSNESYFTSVIVVIITSCLMVVMFCVGVASYLVATSCK